MLDQVDMCRNYSFSAGIWADRFDGRRRAWKRSRRCTHIFARGGIIGCGLRFEAANGAAQVWFGTGAWVGVIGPIVFVIDGVATADKLAGTGIGGTIGRIIRFGGDDKHKAGLFLDGFFALEEEVDHGDITENRDFGFVCGFGFAIEATDDERVAVGNTCEGLDHRLGHSGIEVAGDALYVIYNLCRAGSQFHANRPVRKQRRGDYQ